MHDILGTSGVFFGSVVNFHDCWREATSSDKLLIFLATLERPGFHCSQRVAFAPRATEDHPGGSLRRSAAAEEIEEHLRLPKTTASNRVTSDSRGSKRAEVVRSSVYKGDGANIRERPRKGQERAAFGLLHCIMLEIYSWLRPVSDSSGTAKFLMRTGEPDVYNLLTWSI